MLLLLACATALAEEEKCPDQAYGDYDEHQECDEQSDHGVADRGLIVVATNEIDEVGRHSERGFACVVRAGSRGRGRLGYRSSRQ